MMKKALFAALLLMSTVAWAQEDTADEDGPCLNKWGVDSVETTKNISMFNQYYQEKDYIKAYPYWFYLYNNAPCLKKRITFAGPYMLKKELGVVNDALKEEKAKESPDAAKVAALDARQDRLIDTVFLCYAKRIELWGDEGAVMAEWADDLGKLRPKEREAAMQMFADAVELTGLNTGYKVPIDYVYAAIKQYKKEELSLDQLLQIYSKMVVIIGHNKAIEGKYQEKWLKTDEVVTKLMLPYLDCDKIVEMKEPEFASHKQDTQWLENTIKILSMGNCDKAPFFFKVSEQLYTLKPSPESALALARAARGIGEYNKAIEYYKQGLEGRAASELYDIYLQLSVLSLQTKNYSNVRTYARKALEINESSAEAYVLIGDAYAASRSLCTGSKLKGSEVYWVAVDKYYQAKSLATDEDLKEKIQAKINKYSAYFPDKETAFFEGITDGTSFTVGCWIGETTTVRTISN